MALTLRAASVRPAATVRASRAAPRTAVVAQVCWRERARARGSKRTWLGRGSRAAAAGTLSLHGAVRDLSTPRLAPPRPPGPGLGVWLPSRRGDCSIQAARPRRARPSVQSRLIGIRGAVFLCVSFLTLPSPAHTPSHPSISGRPPEEGCRRRDRRRHPAGRPPGVRPGEYLEGEEEARRTAKKCVWERDPLYAARSRAGRGWTGQPCPRGGQAGRHCVRLGERTRVPRPGPGK